MPSIVPERGDFIVLNFNPQAGYEQAGRRNAIVLSPKEFNQATGFIAVCPITNQKKGYPFEVDLPEKGISLDDGFPITGVVLTDQIKSLDWQARNLKVLKPYHSKDAQVEEIEEIIDECLAKISTYLT
ncbi:type II toxin-antitoxin system PemK/MazF family toxin [Heyndrickxia coagulans]|jgi:mRNA interferase MazF|uniref:type II toxin-antitoxin system PemK/MazF family toxin n=1 Tax=Heyndrickxia coagulans TaxID=1398 RepID=UPI00105F8093|nr:type II toxin-antitoxin system PemK/MazF family toxin [Heyndrickxia coagulans]MBF8417901.1 type II toxin-antitoxin system PemK/MazF family toxin [Heyndrickxia coagulans]MDT9754781.1 type II toxin-antitoxin system PemK/MazF family toxin [Heyndrickxia coagulans]MED4343930.1 type II toxin-antitoxin system PemK/MazF family toxin [Heyndrickxia coagulans]